jgi:hypothetical protein
MKKIVLIFTIVFSVFKIEAQKMEFNKNIDKDSLFQVVIKKLPNELKKDIINSYNEGNEQNKEFILFMLAMPESSKKELIENIEKKKKEIQNLKVEYLKLVPKNYIVEIEFEAESKIVNQPENITLKILKKKDKIKSKSKLPSKTLERADGLELVSQNWNLYYDSEILETEINKIGWNKETLVKIKKFLNDANCISIKNGEITNIGFARSKMGKYSLNLFEKTLTEKQIEKYNDGCTYIYLKENIVLEYGGGAVGSQCFEKE